MVDTADHVDTEFEELSPLEQWDILVNDKREIEAELGSINTERLREEQQAIRRLNLPADKSRKRWLERKAALYQKRNDLIREKAEVEQMLQKLKPAAEKAKAESRDQFMVDSGVVSEIRRLADACQTIATELQRMRTIRGVYDTDPASADSVIQGV